MANVVVPTDGTADIVLASAADPLRAVVFQEDGNSADPMHTFGRANAGATVTHLIAGRSAPVAFRPLVEGNADVFTRTFIIALDVTGTPVPEVLKDRHAFDSLIALIEDPVCPYVTVMDGHGSRWFAFAEFVEGSYTWKMHKHLASVKFTEVSADPVPITTSLPWTGTTLPPPPPPPSGIFYEQNESGGFQLNETGGKVPFG